MAISHDKSRFLRQERNVWGVLREKRKQLEAANTLLATKCAEAEDMRLRCADLSVEAASAREQAAPLEARVKALEEELDRVKSEQDSARSNAELEAAKVGTLSRELETGKVDLVLKEAALEEARTAASSSRSEAQTWREKAEGIFYLRVSLLRG